MLYQKRFKREKKVRSRLQQQLDIEMKRRQQLEDVIKSTGVGVTSASNDNLRSANGE